MDTILIIEDDIHLGPAIRKGLHEQGFTVAVADTGVKALAVVKHEPPALLVLDLGLPDCDGVDLLQTFRQAGYEGLVLILTARDTLTDKVQGLDAGADDYLIKPFAFAELVARIRALLRRSTTAARVLTAGNLKVDLVTRRVTRNDRDIDLTPREVDLLAYLADHAGEIVSRDMLAEHVWREPSRFTPLDNVIDVHVSRLRRKLIDDSGNCPLRVVRSRGIVLEKLV